MLTQEEKMWAASSHLSYLLGLPVILPLILYLWKKDDSPFVAAQAKQAVGLHLVACVVATILLFFCVGTFGIGTFVAVPLLALLGTAAVIFSVVAVLRIAEGKSYHYPIFGDWVDRL